MKHFFHITVVAVSLWGTTVSAQQNDAAIEAKRIATQLCVTCHGTKGVSVIENYPNLAGQREAYLFKQMKDFQEGNRKDPVMWNMAASLDDKIISELAKYYASQKLPQPLN